MTTPYTYRTSSDFINELKFDHVATYSFQRGSKWEEYLKSALTAYQALHRRKERHGDWILFYDPNSLFSVNFTEYPIPNLK